MPPESARAAQWRELERRVGEAVGGVLEEIRGHFTGRVRDQAREITAALLEPRLGKGSFQRREQLDFGVLVPGDEFAPRRGAGADIGPDAVLIFEVELIKAKT